MQLGVEKHELIPFLDLTSLEGNDTSHTIQQLCEKAVTGYTINDRHFQVAAVCVYPYFIDLLTEQLAGSSIKRAVVSTYFPSGLVADSVLEFDVKCCVSKGVDEIDMVINRGQLLEGNFNAVEKTIQAVRTASNGVQLKVILETCELENEQNIRKACKLALENGADFLKTSTGKGKAGADLWSSRIMLEEIRTYYQQTGKKVGFKAAGGIRTFEQALGYYQLVGEVCGAEWLKPQFFRIGASSLYSELTAYH